MSIYERYRGVGGAALAGLGEARARLEAVEQRRAAEAAQQVAVGQQLLHDPQVRLAMGPEEEAEAYERLNGLEASLGLKPTPYVDVPKQEFAKQIYAGQVTVAGQALPAEEREALLGIIADGVMARFGQERVARYMVDLRNQQELAQAAVSQAQGKPRPEAAEPPMEARQWVRSLIEPYAPAAVGEAGTVVRPAEVTLTAAPGGTGKVPSGGQPAPGGAKPGGPTAPGTATAPGGAKPAAPPAGKPAPQPAGKQEKAPAGPSTAVAGFPKKEVLADFEEACKKYNVPLDLALALGCWESMGFQESARSTKDARGIMQVLPGTAAGLGEDPNTRKGNIYAGVRYLGQQLTKYNNDVDLALAAYNWGPGHLDRHLKAGKDLSTAPPETRKHGAGVKNLYKQFKVLLAPKPKQPVGGGDAKR